MRAPLICLALVALAGFGLTTVQSPLEAPPEREGRHAIIQESPPGTDRMEKQRLLAAKQARIVNLSGCAPRFHAGRCMERPPHPEIESTGPPPPGRVQIEVLSLEFLARTEPWTLTLYRVGEEQFEPRRVSLWAFEQVQFGTFFRREISELEPGLYDVCLEPLGIWIRAHIGWHSSTQANFELPQLARVRIRPLDSAGLPLHAPALGTLAVARVDQAWWTRAEDDSRLVHSSKGEALIEPPVPSIRAWHTDEGAWEFLCEAGAPIHLQFLGQGQERHEPLLLTPKAGTCEISMEFCQQ